MARKIMVLLGSPRRNGNTHTVAQWFAEGARTAGAEVELIEIARLKSRHGGCIACMGCQKSEQYGCVIEDEVQPVIARMPQADGLVFATPTYFFSPSAQTKSVLDRMYSLFKFDPGTGSYTHPLEKVRLGLLATAGGGPENGLSLVESTFTTMAAFTGIPYTSLLVPFAPTEMGAMQQQPEIREKAIAFGRGFLP